MDYRDLLMKYIAHVGDRDGMTYLGPKSAPSQWINDEEWAELRKLNEESEKYDPDDARIAELSKG